MLQKPDQFQCSKRRRYLISVTVFLLSGQGSGRTHTFNCIAQTSPKHIALMDSRYLLVYYPKRQHSDYCSSGTCRFPLLFARNFWCATPLSMMQSSFCEFMGWKNSGKPLLTALQSTARTNKYRRSYIEITIAVFFSKARYHLLDLSSLIFGRQCSACS